MSSRSTASSFSVVTELSAQERRVRPAGDIDVLTIDRVAEALLAAERSGAPRVCLDLRSVRFMDSNGVHLAVAAVKRSKGHGRRLRLIPGPERVQRVFRLTGTEALLPFD